MAGDAFLTLGESYRLAAEVSQDTAFTIASGSVLAYVYDADGAATVSGAVGQTDSDAAATEHQISYLWTPGAAGDYTWLLYYSDGDQTRSERGAALVWPRASLFDRYLARIKDWIQETPEGEALQLASQRTYRNALLSALDAYNDFVDPDATYSLTHTADDLPSGIFQSLTEYAAGVVLAGPAANRAAQENDPQIAAAVVSFRDMQARRRQQGMDMMKRAKARWGEGTLRTARIVTSTPNEYLDSYRPSWVGESEFITE